MASNKCRICGKPLTDPISVEVEIGPVCRIMAKNKASKDDSCLTLFHKEPNFDYGFDENDLLLYIEDCNKEDGMSVTNAINYILNGIKRWEELTELPHFIMYRDSMGIWDGISYNNGSISFYSINERNYSKAKQVCLSKKQGAISIESHA